MAAAVGRSAELFTISPSLSSVLVSAPQVTVKR